MQLIDDFVTTKYNIELLKMKLQKEKSKAAGALGGAPLPGVPLQAVQAGVTGLTPDGLTGPPPPIGLELKDLNKSKHGGMGNMPGLY